MARPPHTHREITPSYLESQSNTTQINAKAHRYITDTSLPGHAEATEPQHSTQTHATTPAHRKHRPDTRRHTRSGSPHQGSKTHHTPIPWTHNPRHSTARPTLVPATQHAPHSEFIADPGVHPRQPRASLQTPADTLTRRDKSQGAHWLICGSGFRLRSAGLGPPLRPSPLPRTWSAGVPTLPISFPRLYTRPELGSRRKTETNGQQLRRRRRRRGRGSIPPRGPGWRTGAASGATTAHRAAPGAARYWGASYWPRGEGWSPDAPGDRCGRGRARGGSWACGEAGLAGVPGTRAALASCT